MSISDALGRDHDDRHLRLRAELPAHVDARDLGQHHVEQHEVGPHGVEQVERLGAVARHLHPEPLAGEADGEGVDEAVLVLDDEDGGGGRRHLRFLRGRAAQAAAWGGVAWRRGPGPAGSRRVKVEPSPSREETVTSPSWFWTTWRTMARPRPVPPVSRLRARSTR